MELRSTANFFFQYFCKMHATITDFFRNRFRKAALGWERLMTPNPERLRLAEVGQNSGVRNVGADIKIWRTSDLPPTGGVHTASPVGLQARFICADGH